MREGLVKVIYNVAFFVLECVFIVCCRNISLFLYEGRSLLWWDFGVTLCFCWFAFRKANFQFLGVRYLSKVVYDVEGTMM